VNPYAISGPPPPSPYIPAPAPSDFHLVPEKVRDKDTGREYIVYRWEKKWARIGARLTSSDTLLSMKDEPERKAKRQRKGVKVEESPVLTAEQEEPQSSANASATPSISGSESLASPVNPLASPQY
jgi:hypothetical protein